MERVSLVAQPRAELGKNAVKRVRNAGMVPAVLYGRSRTPVPLAIDRKALLGALQTEAGRNVLIDLRVKGNREESSDTVMIAEIQHDHLKRQVLHVDLHQISLTEQVEARVRIVLSGVPEGVAAGGGILEQHLRELVVRCLPTAIPEHVTINVQDLRLGASLHVREVPPLEGIEVITPPRRGDRRGRRPEGGRGGGRPRRGGCAGGAGGHWQGARARRSGGEGGARDSARSQGSQGRGEARQAGEERVAGGVAG